MYTGQRRRLPGIVSKKYKKYMQSPTWKAKRAQVLKRDGYKCKVCKSKVRLHVHHLSYNLFGHEPLKDLVTLCSRCHRSVHKFWWKKGRRSDGHLIFMLYKDAYDAKLAKKKR